MRKPTRNWARMAVPALLLATCGAAIATDAGPDADKVLYIRSEMAGPVNEATAALWDVGNAAMGEDGDIDPALMSDESWDRVAQAASALEAASNRMAEAQAIRAALPGHEQDEEPGTYSMADIQGYIDADPQLFQEMSRAMAHHSAKIRTAANARQAAETSLLVGELDQVCESCHTRYWYPEG